jgi:peptidoglycan/xylan/chitin deacetylase (PgdA/CDA1 family)
MAPFISDKTGEGMQARAIMYHDVVENGDFESSGFPGAGANVYKLRREDFACHLEAIRHVVEAGAISRIAARRQWNAPPPVFLTFDDGGVTSYAPVAGMLEDHGWRGHFFITADCIGTPGFLSETQIRDLHARGHVIGSHSRSHPTRMAALSRASIDHEWIDSLARLSDILGQPVKVASVPGGYYSRAVSQSAAAAGIEVLFTSEPTASVESVEGCLVLGRYVVHRGMPPHWSAGFAAGWRIPCWRQTALWNFKRVAKALGGGVYVKLRDAILER